MLQTKELSNRGKILSRNRGIQMADAWVRWQLQKMKRQTLRGTISLRPNWSTRLTVISESFALFFLLFPTISYAATSTMRPITSKSCFQREQPDLVELLDLYPDDRPWEWRKREFVKPFVERDLINIVDQCIPCTEKIKRYSFGPRNEK